MRKDIHQELFSACRPRCGSVICKTVTFKTGDFNVKGLQVKTFLAFPERELGRGSFSDFLKVTIFTKNHLSPLVFRGANHTTSSY